MKIKFISILGGVIILFIVLFKPSTANNIPNNIGYDIKLSSTLIFDIREIEAIYKLEKDDYSSQNGKMKTNLCFKSGHCISTTMSFEKVLDKIYTNNRIGD